MAIQCKSDVISGSIALLHTGSVLSHVPVTNETKGHAVVSGPYCHWSSGDIQTQLLLRTKSVFMILPQLAGVCAEVWILHCHQKSHRGPGLGPEVLVVCSGKTFPSEWPFLSHRARMLSGPKLLPRAMFESMVQLQLNSVWISVASVLSRGLVTM